MVGGDVEEKAFPRHQHRELDPDSTEHRTLGGKSVGLRRLPPSRWPAA
jgi:hypothetical protein